MLSMSDVYGQLLTWLLSDASVVETNARTGSRVAVGVGPTSFRLDLSDRVLPTVGLRRLYPRSAAAEVAWYLMGTQDAAFITKYAPLWDKFIEDIPNRHWPTGPATVRGVAAAYGYRWRHHFARDQLELAVRALRDDPSDRRVLVSAWDPSLDGLGARGQANVPCPAFFTLSIVGGRLHSALFLRSSDVFVGLPYDVMGHALLMAAIAETLDVGLGHAHFTLAHAHLYECHWDMARECLRREPVVPSIEMPDWGLFDIVDAPDGYVAHVTDLCSGAVWPSYAPRPEVVA